MNLPDVKGEAYRNLENISDGILGIIQIMADDECHLSVCVGGIPEVIVKSLARVMKDNEQIKDLFEAALKEANTPDFESLN